MSIGAPKRKQVRPQLEQSDLEDLSAFLDGELAGDRLAEVRRLVQTDAAWRQASAELAALGDVLGTVQAPAHSDGLAERIKLSARRDAQSGARLRLVRWLAPLAAAAAIVLAVFIYGPQANDPADKVADTPGKIGDAAPTGSPDADAATVALQGLAAEDQFVVENLEFVRDYSVLEDFETLQAIEEIEKQG